MDVKSFFKKAVLHVLFVVVGALGIIILGIGIAVYQNEQAKIKNYELVVGELISYTEVGDLYAPTYQYVVDGKQYYIQSDYARKVKEETGTRQEIYFNPENPYHAVIKEFNPDVLLIVIGIMMIFTPIVAFMVDYGSNRKDEHLDAKSVFVIALGIFFYCFAGNLIGNYLPGTLMIYSPLLVIVPAAFLVVGVYTLTKSIILDRKEAKLLAMGEEKKTKTKKKSTRRKKPKKKTTSEESL